MSPADTFFVPPDMLQVYHPAGKLASKFQGRQPEERALSLLWTEDIKALACSADRCTLGPWYAKDDKSTFFEFCGQKEYGKDRTKGCLVCGA
jgi:hypothetical protein